MRWRGDVVRATGDGGATLAAAVREGKVEVAAVAPSDVAEVERGRVVVGEVSAMRPTPVVGERQVSRTPATVGGHVDQDGVPTRIRVERRDAGVGVGLLRGRVAVRAACGLVADHGSEAVRIPVVTHREGLT